MLAHPVPWLSRIKQRSPKSLLVRSARRATSNSPTHSLALLAPLWIADHIAADWFVALNTRRTETGPVYPSPSAAQDFRDITDPEQRASADRPTVRDHPSRSTGREVGEFTAGQRNRQSETTTRAEYRNAGESRAPQMDEGGRRFGAGAINLSTPLRGRRA